VGKWEMGEGREGEQSKCSNNNCNQWLLVRAEIGRILPDIWPVITVMPLQTATVSQVKCVCSKKGIKLNCGKVCEY